MDEWSVDDIQFVITKCHPIQEHVDGWWMDGWIWRWNLKGKRYEAAIDELSFFWKSQILLILYEESVEEWFCNIRQKANSFCYGKGEREGEEERESDGIICR